MWCYPQNNLQGFRLGCIKFVGKDEKTPSWQHRAFLWIWTVSQSPWFLGGRFCFIFHHIALKNVLLDLHLIICFWIRYRCIVFFPILLVCYLQEGKWILPINLVSYNWSKLLSRSKKFLSILWGFLCIYYHVMWEQR